MHEYLKDYAMNSSPPPPTPISPLSPIPSLSPTPLPLFALLLYLYPPPSHPNLIPWQQLVLASFHKGFYNARHHNFARHSHTHKKFILFNEWTTRFSSFYQLLSPLLPLFHQIPSLTLSLPWLSLLSTFFSPSPPSKILFTRMPSFSYFPKDTTLLFLYPLSNAILTSSTLQPMLPHKIGIAFSVIIDKEKTES